MLTILCVLIITVINFPNVILVREEIDSEDSNRSVYCDEKILHTVQLSKYFHNSQDFVDMKLKKRPKTIRENFKKVKNKDKEIKKFIQDNFEPEPNLSEFCTWEDFPEFPDIDEHISDVKYRLFYRNINKMWGKFAVKIPSYYQNKEESMYHSIIYVPNCYMKKDNSDNMPTLLQSYWIIRGMLTNGMFDKVEQMLRNYAYLIDMYNFVPYTNRVYAEDRAQYPLFALMVESYISQVKNKQFLLDMLPVLQKEYDWWSQKRNLKITRDEKVYHIFHYYQFSSTPRPEVYKYDYNLAKKLREVEANKIRLYSALHCLNACGFGFSNRFLLHTSSNYKENLLNLKVSNIIPVELNSVLYRYAFLLGKWYTNVNNEKAKKYMDKAALTKEAMQTVLWDSSKKMWFDYDFINDTPIIVYYPTNLMPLFTFTYDDNEEAAKNAIQYLLDENLITPENFPRHLLLPTTHQKGSLWDFPFGSLFLTAFVIEGLRETKDERAEQLATNMAHALIKVVYDGHDGYGNLLERYNISPNSNGANDYNKQNENKISAASLGCVITMLRRYGKVANSGDYHSVLTADYYSSQELVYAPAPLSMDTTDLDLESGEITPTETDDDNEFDDVEFEGVTELDNVNELERASKRQRRT